MTIDENINYEFIHGIYYLEQLDGFEFEKLCKKIFSNLYKGKIEQTSLVGDKGKDLIIYADEGKIFIECKHHLNGTIGRPVIQKLHSALIIEGASKGIVVTTGIFSIGAIEYAKQVSPPIELVDINILFDYAIRSGYRLYSTFREGSIYEFPISNKEKLQEKISRYCIEKLVSKPNEFSKILKIKSREIFYEPYYSLNYEINSVFATSIGIVHNEVHQGKLYLKGNNATIYDEGGEINKYFSGSLQKNYSPKSEDYIKVKPFSILSNQIIETSTNYIINKHTTTVQYVAGNNRTYFKECIPKRKDISLYNIQQLYVPLNDIQTDLIGQNRNFNFYENGTDNILIKKDDISKCEICNSDIGNIGILCNECGSISHDKKFWNSHGFYCKECEKSICRNCARYYPKWIFFKNVLCSECSKKVKDKTIKKFTPIK